MKKYGLVPVALCCLLLFSCATTAVRTDREPHPSDAKSDLTSIERHISAGSPLMALAEISAAERMGVGIPRTKLDDLSSLANAKIREQFKKSVEAGDFESAYPLFASAGAVDPSVFSGWTTAKVALGLAEQYRKKNMLIPALLWFDRALKEGADVAPLIASYGELALSEQDRPVISDIAGYLEKAKLKVPKGYTSLLTQKTTPTEMLKGVVTIWVNRGIQVENGIGFPDRIIGSGFFIDKEGYLITNYHVIASVVDSSSKEYARLFIRLSDAGNAKIPAKVVGYDKIFDIALLKADVKPQFIFSLTSSDALEPGQKVYAIGSPGGLENTVTSGIISATRRRLQQVGDVMQIDVPVNPGNSGGPLIDDKSLVLGVVFAGIEQFQGVNFAIPSFWVTQLLPALYQGGEIHHSWLGMALQETTTGLQVVYVLPGSPAARAGLQVGDMLASLDGEKYATVLEVQSRLLSLPIGSLVHLTWTRGSTMENGFLALAARPFAPLEEELPHQPRQSFFGVLFGMDVKETGHFLWHTDYLVTKVYTNSPADEAGLSAGDLITVTSWKVDMKKDYAALQFTVKKKTKEFLHNVVEFAAGLLVNNFI